MNYNGLNQYFISCRAEPVVSNISLPASKGYVEACTLRRGGSRRQFVLFNNPPEFPSRGGRSGSGWDFGWNSCPLGHRYRPETRNCPIDAMKRNRRGPGPVHRTGRLCRSGGLTTRSSHDKSGTGCRTWQTLLSLPTARE